MILLAISSLMKFAWFQNLIGPAGCNAAPQLNLSDQRGRRESHAVAEQLAEGAGLQVAYLGSADLAQRLQQLLVQSGCLS
jgi:hypothetical protein